MTPTSANELAARGGKSQRQIPRILFYVQHLLGVGHVFRARRIAEALVKAGFSVDLVYGGEKIPGFDVAGATVHYLPALRAGAVTFNKLETPDGSLADEAYRERRCKMLLAIFEQTRPDIILTEAFPFGRRQMRFELLPLLEAAAGRSPPPVIVSSIRDILQEDRKPARDRETVDTLRQWFSHVLVHADPRIVRLDKTFPFIDDIRDKLLYSGIVAPDLSPERVEDGADDEAFDVVVSVGGGALGRDLLFAAAGAKALSSMKEARWCIVTGINTAPDDVERVRRMVTADVRLKRFVPDLPSVLSRARLSISRAGYNTVADIYRAGVRAVVAPLWDGEETEQLRRAEYLARAGLAEIIMPDQQTPERVAAAIDRAIAAPPPDRSQIDLNGAARTAEILWQIIDGGDLSAYR